MKRLTRALLRQFAKAAQPYLQSYGLLRTSKVFNASCIVWEPGAERVLVLAPHMDDETIGCGGTLALHARAGGNVTVVFLTDGRNGGGPQIKPLHGATLAIEQKKLVDVRKAEARAALRRLGISNMVFLDAEDGALARAVGVADKVRAIVEAEKPELVYLPYFLEQHPDHFAASRVFLEAMSQTNMNPQCLGYEVWTPLFPNCVVKIDEVLGVKKDALSQYQSQLTQTDYLHSALGLNAYRSAAFKENLGRFAEAFYCVPLVQYRAMFHTYCATE
jgi:LmbE family N-acetylglucosaminyl deacetylase